MLGWRVSEGEQVICEKARRIPAFSTVVVLNVHPGSALLGAS